MCSSDTSNPLVYFGRDLIGSGWDTSVDILNQAEDGVVFDSIEYCLTIPFGK